MLVVYHHAAAHCFHVMKEYNPSSEGFVEVRSGCRSSLDPSPVTAGGTHPRRVGPQRSYSVFTMMVVSTL